MSENSKKFDQLPDNWLSNYVDDGFAKDKPNFENVEIDLEKRVIKATVGFKSFYENAQGFHLSVLTAYRIAVQLINAYLCAHYDTDKITLGTTTAISQSMDCRKPINTQSFEVEAICKKLVERDSVVYGHFDYDFGNGAFVGYVRGRVGKPKK